MLFAIQPTQIVDKILNNIYSLPQQNSLIFLIYSVQTCFAYEVSQICDRWIHCTLYKVACCLQNKSAFFNISADLLNLGIFGCAVKWFYVLFICVVIPSNYKGPVTRCNFSCNLQRNSTFKRCKFVTNVWYVKSTLANCDGNMYLPISHLLRIDLHCKLQKKIAPSDTTLSTLEWKGGGGGGGQLKPV